MRRERKRPKKQRQCERNHQRRIARFEAQTGEPPSLLGFADEFAERAVSAARRRGASKEANVDEDPKEIAQGVAFYAMETVDPDRSVALARRALSFDPGCADALGLIAVHEGATPEDRLEGVRAAVAAAERSIGRERFEEWRGKFWDEVETRPYVRQRLTLARLLCEAGREQEAAVEWGALLALAPKDGMQARVPLAAFYLETGRVDDAAALLARFETHDSESAWARALAERLSGREANARDALEIAMRGCPLAAGFFDGRWTPPRILYDVDAPDGHRRARVQGATLGRAWAAHPDAVLWLRARMAERDCARFAAPHPALAAAPAGDDGEPTLEEWRALYASALRFQDATPWSWMQPSPIFGVEDPDTREIGWLAMTEEPGEMRAVAVYRDSEFVHRALALHRDEHADVGSPTELPALMVFYAVPRSLPPGERARAERLGLKSRRGEWWPCFRANATSIDGSPPDGADARFLARVLEQALAVAWQALDDPESVEPRDDRVLVRAFGPPAPDAPQAWRDEWRVPPPPEQATFPPLDEIRVRKLRARATRTPDTWECDGFLAPFDVGRGDDAVRPAMGLTVNTATGDVASGLASHFDGGLAARELLLTALERDAKIPMRIRVARPRVAQALEPLARALGIVVESVPRLPIVEEAKKTLKKLRSWNGVQWPPKELET